MHRGLFKDIDKVCLELLKLNRNDNQALRKLVNDSIRLKVINKDTLPLILQRCALRHGDWQLALQILQCDALNKKDFQLDENIWRIVHRSVPAHPEAKSTASKVLAEIFGRKK